MAKKAETAKKKPAAKAAAKKAAKKAPSSSAKPRGLGRGLSSLLGDAGVAAATGTAAARGTGASQADVAGPGQTPQSLLAGLGEIPVEWINVGPWQPRRLFDKERLAELAESIRAKGLVQPILVRLQQGAANRYQLIAGERRWRAAQMAQLHVIPAIIREMSDEEAHELALIENVQRADLSAVEEAEGYRQLIDNFGYTQDQLSEIIGKSRSHIANLLRLLTLPEEVRKLVVEGRLSMGQVRPLIGHPDCVVLARKVVEKGLSARQVEALVKSQKSASAAGKAKVNEPKVMKTADIRALEESMQAKLGLRLDIEWHEDKNRGRLVMHFNSLEQFESVIEKLEAD
ncbi:MAG: ParB/RepB/Spo0J family partition protein [Pseudomonadota bacterium]|nr:ParB/RepB/Spo0J family partition protein [Pseudomonadota bacterium]